MLRLPSLHLQPRGTQNTSIDFCLVEEILAKPSNPPPGFTAIVTTASLLTRQFYSVSQITEHHSLTMAALLYMVAF